MGFCRGEGNAIASSSSAGVASVSSLRVARVARPLSVTMNGSGRVRFSSAADFVVLLPLRLDGPPLRFLLTTCATKYYLPRISLRGSHLRIPLDLCFFVACRAREIPPL